MGTCFADLASKQETDVVSVLESGANDYATGFLYYCFSSKNQSSPVFKCVSLTVCVSVGVGGKGGDGGEGTLPDLTDATIIRTLLWFTPDFSKGCLPCLGAGRKGREGGKGGVRTYLALLPRGQIFGVKLKYFRIAIEIKHAYTKINQDAN